MIRRVTKIIVALAIFCAVYAAIIPVTDLGLRVIGEPQSFAVTFLAAMALSVYILASLFVAFVVCKWLAELILFGHWVK